MTRKKQLFITGTALFIVSLLTFSTLSQSTEGQAAAPPLTCSDFKYDLTAHGAGEGKYQDAIDDCLDSLEADCKKGQEALCTICRTKIISGKRCGCKPDDPRPFFCSVTNEKDCVEPVYKTNKDGKREVIGHKQKRDKAGRIINCNAKGDADCGATCTNTKTAPKPWWTEVRLPEP